MNSDIEKRFTSYLNKVLKGYSKRKKILYQNELSIKSELSEIDIAKLSFKDYLLADDEGLQNIDVDINHLENIFQNELYYKAMKNVPLNQRQVLYLLFVDDYTTKEIANYFRTTPNNINKLKQQAIINFKKNLKELNSNG